MSGEPIDAVLEVMDEAVRAGIFVPEGDRLAFRHDLLREALYEDMGVAAQRSRHLAAGRALATGGTAPLEVAYHFVRALVTEDDMAVDWLLAAAGQAIDINTAAELLEARCDGWHPPTRGPPRSRPRPSPAWAGRGAWPTPRRSPSACGPTSAPVVQPCEPPCAGVGCASACEAPAQRPATGWDSLTPTEQRVAALAAEGLTSRQIGDRLYVSTFTVGSHLRHIYQKLGINSRLQLAAEARHHDPPTSADPRARGRPFRGETVVGHVAAGVARSSCGHRPRGWRT